MQSEFLAKLFGDKVDPRRRLETLFGDVSISTGPPPAAREWAARTLFESQIDPLAAELAAIKVLRDAQPRLTLRSAVFLVKDAQRQRNISVR